MHASSGGRIGIHIVVLGADGVKRFPCPCVSHFRPPNDYFYPGLPGRMAPASESRKAMHGVRLISSYLLGFTADKLVIVQEACVQSPTSAPLCDKKHKAGCNITQRPDSSGNPQDSGTPNQTKGHTLQIN